MMFLERLAIEVAVPLPSDFSSAGETQDFAVLIAETLPFWHHIPPRTDFTTLLRLRASDDAKSKTKMMSRQREAAVEILATMMLITLLLLAGLLRCYRGGNSYSNLGL